MILISKQKPLLDNEIKTQYQVKQLGWVNLKNSCFSWSVVCNCLYSRVDKPSNLIIVTPLKFKIIIYIN